MKAELTVRAGRGAGKSYEIRLDQRIVLGRSSEAGLRIDDGLVSRRHARLELSETGLRITDLGSSNGTFLDGAQVDPAKPRLIPPGSTATLRVGVHTLHVALGSEDELGLDEDTQRLLEEDLPREGLEILGEIGRGGMGRVYAARQEFLDRRVAIKVLDARAQDEESRTRFLREAKVCTRLRSPYLVEVYDVRPIQETRLYIVMELVNGQSAWDRVEAGPLPIEEVLRIGEGVARGLAAAHAHDIIHRDVKPANILLTDDEVKLTDFGIAKIIGESDRLTRTGEGLGTLAYVSPEQAIHAKGVDGRTDLYSLGATLYHLIAGRPPFVGQGAQVLMQIATSDPEPLLRLAPHCPPRLAQLVHRLLEKEPDKRLASAAQVVDELVEEFVGAETAHTTLGGADLQRLLARARLRDGEADSGG